MATEYPNLELCINEKFHMSYVDHEQGIVISQWIGYAPSAPMHKVSDGVIELLKTKNCTKILNDFSKGQVVAPEDQKWVHSDWFPRAIQAGLTHMGFVRSASVFNQSTVNAIMDNVNHDYPGLKFQYFETAEAALIWLHNDR